MSVLDAARRLSDAHTTLTQTRLWLDKEADALRERWKIQEKKG